MHFLKLLVSVGVAFCFSFAFAQRRSNSSFGSNQGGQTSSPSNSNSSLRLNGVPIDTSRSPASSIQLNGTPVSAGGEEQVDRPTAQDPFTVGLQDHIRKCSIEGGGDWSDCASEYRNMCPPGNVNTGTTCMKKDAYCAQQGCNENPESSACQAVNCGSGNQNAALDCSGGNVSYEGRCISQEAACSSCQANGGDCSQYNCGSNNNAEADTAACDSAKSKVDVDCDSQSQSWMSEMNSMAQQIGPAFNPNQSTCGTLAALDIASKGSLATFQFSCKSSADECKMACKPNPMYTANPMYKQQADRMAYNLQSCNQMSTKGQQAQASAVQATQALSSAVQSCANTMGGLDQLAQGHCDIPANKNTPACQAMNLGGLAVNGSGIESAGPGLVQGGVGGTPGNAEGQSFALGNLDSGGEEEGVTPHASRPGEEIGGAKGGGGVSASGGGGDGGAGGNGKGRGGLSGLVSNILSGFFGGGGGGGSGSGKGGGWKGFFGGDKKQAANQNRNKTPDLRQFMPGGLKDPNRNRGLAGQFIGRDGISGPHANIWKLVNNRYQYKRASLAP